ncbi:hypothetical protein C8J56DRAFT_940179 [Mycena floridula]|nr:hypothetical protein C8J56DRAFT_940179 [Mycena floridula]
MTTNYSSFFSSGLLAPSLPLFSITTSKPRERESPRPLLSVDINLKPTMTDGLLSPVSAALDDGSDVECGNISKSRRSVTPMTPRRRRRSSISTQMSPVSALRSPSRALHHLPFMLEEGEKKVEKRVRRRRPIPLSAAPAPNMPLPALPNSAPRASDGQFLFPRKRGYTMPNSAPPGGNFWEHDDDTMRVD